MGAMDRETFSSIVRDKTGFNWGEICRAARIECPEDPPMGDDMEADTAPHVVGNPFGASKLSLAPFSNQ